MGIEDHVLGREGKKEGMRTLSSGGVYWQRDCGLGRPELHVRKAGGEATLWLPLPGSVARKASPCQEWNRAGWPR